MFHLVFSVSLRLFQTFHAYMLICNLTALILTSTLKLPRLHHVILKRRDLELESFQSQSDDGIAAGVMQQELSSTLK